MDGAIMDIYVATYDEVCALVLESIANCKAVEFDPVYDVWFIDGDRISVDPAMVTR